MPFGYWVVRLLRGEDVREQGSGNIGATNVWRTYGRCYGIPVMLLDVAKGFVPALVGVIVSATSSVSSPAARRWSGTGGRSSSASARRQDGRDRAAA